jgi:NTP pyrophosphatase (non-canonical NTP hydrolase)
MLEHIQQIISRSQARMTHFQTEESSRYKGAETYFEEIRKEIDEAEAENRDKNQIYLEDELGDVFWDYVMLLNALASEGKISSIEKVFERCHKKFSERVCENGKNA